MKNNTILMIIIVIVGVAGGFLGGMKYQQSKVPSFAGRQFAGQNGGIPGQRGRQNGFRPVTGEILSLDDKSITVKMQDGSSKIVLLTDKTTISKASDGTKSDLKVGTRVGVFGSDNADGSVTAQNVQLNPMMRGLSGSGQPQPSPAQ